MKRTKLCIGLILVGVQLLCSCSSREVSSNMQSDERLSPESNNYSDTIAIIESQIVAQYNGLDYTMYLYSDGKVYAEGSNDSGALATGDFEEREGLVEIILPEKAISIDDCLAIGESNTVYVWGVGYYKEQQQFNPKWRPENPYLSCAVDVISIPFSKNIKKINKTWDYINLLTDDGEVYTYGAYSKYNPLYEQDEAAAGISVYPTAEFVKMEFGETISDIACGEYHTIALGASGAIYGYGSSYFGQLGTDELNELSYSEPAAIAFDDVKAIACTNFESYVLREDGTLYRSSSVKSVGDTVSGFIEFDTIEPIKHVFVSAEAELTILGESGLLYNEDMQIIESSISNGSILPDIPSSEISRY